MASLVTFGDIITAAQQRADMYGSGFISDSEWESMANSSLKNLYEKMVEAYGADYWVQTPYSFTTDGTNERYALPSDHFKLLGVDVAQGPATTGTQWFTAWRFNFSERNRFSFPLALGSLWPGLVLRYRLVGANIWLSPLPQSGIALRLWYAPIFVNLVNDSDTFDGINGWEEWAINHIAMKALVKEESDISQVKALWDIEEERLVHVTESRDAATAGTIVDVYRANMGDGYDGGWGY